MTIEELYIKSRKQYIHFLKYTNPRKVEMFENAPRNLLELLDNSHRRMHLLKSKITILQ